MTTPIDMALAAEIVAAGTASGKMVVTAESCTGGMVAAALTEVGLSDHRDQLWQTLSGGERQRVQLARALAQRPTHLLLDEPTNHLDIQHQIEILSLVSRLALTTVVALHDLNLAARFCHRVGVLQNGRLVACGPPAEVLTRDLIARVFSVAAEVAPSAHHGRPHVQFLMDEPE